MKLDFSYVMEMYRNGLVPQDLLVSYAVKKIALEGDRSDFDALPEWLRDEIRNRLILFRETGVWKIVSNNGIQDYEEFASKFDQEILQNN